MSSNVRNFLAGFDNPSLAETRNRSSSFRFATVTSLEPVRIRYDTDPKPLLAQVDTLASGLWIGARVWVQIVGNYVLILGATSQTYASTDGAQVFAPGTNWVINNAKSWAVRSAAGLVTWSLEVTTSAAISAGVTVGPGTLKAPYAPEMPQAAGGPTLEIPISFGVHQAPGGGVIWPRLSGRMYSSGGMFIYSGDAIAAGSLLRLGGSHFAGTGAISET